MQQHLGNAGASVITAAAVSPRGLRLARNVSVVLTVLAVAALCAFAVSGGDPVTRKTTVKTADTRPLGSPAATTPAASTPAAPSASAFVSSAPLQATNPAPPIPTTAGALSPAASQVAPAATTATPAPPAAGSGSPAVTPEALPACPLPLPAPTNPGGLQSLVPLAPTFGPFSSEAFAAAPLFAPLLEPIGPFLVAFANAYAANSTAVAPVLAQLESLENQGFGVLSVVYGPYRSQFLQAESNLATALGPVAKALGENEGTSCLVDIEGLLTQAASSSASNA